MEEKILDDRYVPRPEFTMYCRSVNGDLTDLKIGVSNIDSKMEQRFKETLEHFDLIVGAETERRREDVQRAFTNTEKALVAATAATDKALEGTMNKTYAIIITILTGVMMSAVGALLALVLTKARA
jgi:t-SNARE complex subunit (syntaxin)